ERRGLVFNFKNTLGCFGRRLWKQLGLDQDNRRPPVTDFYRFCLSEPALDGMLCSLGDPREVKALGRALRKPPLEAREQSYLLSVGRVYRDLHGGRELT